MRKSQWRNPARRKTIRIKLADKVLSGAHKRCLLKAYKLSIAPGSCGKNNRIFGCKRVGFSWIRIQTQTKIQCINLESGPTSMDPTGIPDQKEMNSVIAPLVQVIIYFFFILCCISIYDYLHITLLTMHSFNNIVVPTSDLIAKRNSECFW